VCNFSGHYRTISHTVNTVDVYLPIIRITLLPIHPVVLLLALFTFSLSFQTLTTKVAVRCTLLVANNCPGGDLLRLGPSAMEYVFLCGMFLHCASNAVNAKQSLAENAAATLDEG
jgi:uncharacterized membrane protein